MCLVSSRSRANLCYVNRKINFRQEHVHKAGYWRWLGFRPVVKGRAMNPVDHPHGGKTSLGRMFPVTPWGILTKWRKTVTLTKFFKQKKKMRRVFLGLE